MLRLLLAGFLSFGSAAGAAEEFRDCADCPVVVPAGKTLIGSTRDETAREGVPERLAARERPRHQVVIARPFAVGKFEVTKGEYARFVTDAAWQGSPGCYIWNAAAGDWAIDLSKSWRDPGFQ